MNAPGDPLAPLVELPGVRSACDEAREAVAAAYRRRLARRHRRDSVAEAPGVALRAARDSAALDGARVQTGGSVTDPVLLGALRAAGELDILVATWRQAPLQALARLHLLAASDLVGARQELGRPREVESVATRLSLLAHVVMTSAVPVPVTAAVVHGELLMLRPFGTADGVVARAASRLVAVAGGLDPENLTVPEAFWLRRRAEYRASAVDFAGGDPGGVGAWIRMCCAAFRAD